MALKNGDITPLREIIQALEKYGSVIFYEKPIYEISKPYLKFQIAKGNNSKKMQRAITRKK